MSISPSNLNYTFCCHPNNSPFSRMLPGSSGHVTVDVEQLAHPGGLTALERLALPQQLLLWEVELLATHCRWGAGAGRRNAGGIWAWWWLLHAGFRQVHPSLRPLPIK